MRDNWETQLIGSLVRLVPYQRKFVDKYHGWMTDPYVLEMTASEPLSMEEEYEMQQTWLNDPHSTYLDLILREYVTVNTCDLFAECTFIVLEKAAADGRRSEIDSMVGDVNIFMHDSRDRGNAEIEVMIAEEMHRRKGFGREALQMMIWYGIEQLSITRYFAKINAENGGSIALFKRCVGERWTKQRGNVCKCWSHYSLGFAEVNFVPAFQEYEFEWIVSSPSGQELFEKSKFAVMQQYEPEE
jgi:RimJ/RimL family protein N-acetyltransferase